MILSMSNQARLFLTAVLIGGFAGFAYDIFRVLRIIVKHGNILTHIEDIIYWLLVSGVTLYFSLNKNYGEIRAFSILGVLLGMLLYFLTLSRLVMKISVAVVNLLQKIFTFAIKIITFPFRMLYKIFFKPIMFIKKLLRKLIKSIKKVLHNIKNYATIKKRNAKKDIGILMKKV